MTKVITYGTYDLLHYGHIRLLERAKALGDYLIVGVTADDFDRTRGKINVQQSLMERVRAVKATGIADEIIIEEYEGQKIDDIKRYDVDIFTVGSDWKGKFDYLNQYCRVVYLDRTEGISSSEIRSEDSSLRLGLVGDSFINVKVAKESLFVNGIELSGICCKNKILIEKLGEKHGLNSMSFDEILNESDALYIVSAPELHYEQIKKALLHGKHILCESPITLSVSQTKELLELAREKGLVLMEAIKTAYSTAFLRLCLLAESEEIGKICAIDSVCTSLVAGSGGCWNSICLWGPTALLPIFRILGTDYRSKRIVSRLSDNTNDSFTNISFIYKNAVASIKVGNGVKSEGELIISGTKGYIYVPAPWWKTDYYEVRFENPADNKRYFYQLDGEGIRYEVSAFVKAIRFGANSVCVSEDVTCAICRIIEDFYNKTDFTQI